MDTSTNLADRVDAIINHRKQKEFHEEQEKILKDELKHLMEELGTDKIKTDSGATAYIGAPTDEYSVPWQSLPEARKNELLAWSYGNGMAQSVNAASFSAFIRSLIAGGTKQADLPAEVNHYTKQNLNIRAGKES